MAERVDELVTDLNGFLDQQSIPWRRLNLLETLRENDVLDTLE